MSLSQLIFGVPNLVDNKLQLILDTYDNTQMLLAYSLRKLNTNYTGNCLRIRRASDNLEQDFGFIGTELNRASINSFIASTAGYVVKWYDQSGNNNHSIQTIATAQPRYLNGKVNYTNNGKYLLFNRLTNIRTAFFNVEKDTSFSGLTFLLGDSTSYTYDFHGGVNNIIFDTSVSSSFINQGIARQNGVQKTIDYNFTYSTRDTFTFVTTDNVVASSIAKDRNLDGRTFFGNYNELILFSIPLPQSQYLTIENNILAQQNITPLLLLNNNPGASIALSLRKLTSSYSGACIRVRRSSDNVEQDIGFVNDVLDIGVLQSFVGSFNGYVTTWYDQSGNGNNAYQTVASKQAKICNAGNIYSVNNQPSIYFDDGTGYITDYNLGAVFSILGVLKANQSSLIRAITSRNNNRLVVLNRDSNSFYNDPGVVSSSTAYPNLGLANLTVSSTESRGFINSQDVTENLTAINNIWGLVGLGIENNNNENYSGYMSEVVIYPTAQINNRTTLESNIINYYNIV